jgi:hypothetical protein
MNGCDEEKTDLVLRQSGGGPFESWAMALRSQKGRIGIGVRQTDNTGASTRYAWLTKAQARKFRDWLTKNLRK